MNIDLSLEALLDPSPQNAIEECCLDTGDLLVDSSFNFSADADVSGIGIEGGGGGLLILIPGMSFRCHGSISSWSGVVSVTAESLSESLEMFLQVWRPVQGGNYGLIGSHSLMFDSTDFRQATPLQGDTKVEDNMDHQRKRYYRFTEEEEISSSGYEAINIPFQPRDVIGCFIPSVPSVDPGNSSLGSLELVFRSTPLCDDREVDLIVFDEVRGEPSEVFSRKKSPRTISSVVPLIRPHCEGRVAIANYSPCLQFELAMWSYVQ